MKQSGQIRPRHGEAAVSWRREGKGPSLLLIPGFGGDRGCWGTLFIRKLVTRGVAPVVYDLRGLGSDLPDDGEPSLEQYASDAAAVLEAVGPPCAVLGWSMGATVALLLAAGRPDLVRGLVLCCGTADHPALVRRFPGRFRVLLDGEASTDDVSDEVLRFAVPPSWEGNRIMMGSLRRSSRSFFARWERGIRAQQRALREAPSLGSALGSLKVPSLVIAGAQDRLVPVEEGEVLARSLPRSRLVVLPGGHGLVYDYPEALASLVAGFLEELGGSEIPEGGITVSDEGKGETDHFEVQRGELRPVGIVRSELKARAECPKQGQEGAPAADVDIYPEYEDALEGIAAGSEVLLLTWLDRADRGTLKVHPRGDRSLPMRGVFSTRSPGRPNPIGLHRVTILERSGCRLRVHPLEALDGTSLLDIKPVRGDGGEG